MRLAPRRRYRATDVDPRYLAYLTNLAHGRPYLEVAELDLEDSVAFAALAGQFDTVVCLNVLEHVKEEAVAADNLAAALVDGGRAIVLVPQGRWLFSPLDAVLGHVKRYTSAELRSVLEDAGLEVESLAQFNRVSVPGWILNGKLLRRTRFPRLQLKLLNVLVPLLRRIDFLFPWPGLSLVAVARKRPSLHQPALGVAADLGTSERVETARKIPPRSARRAQRSERKPLATLSS